MQVESSLYDVWFRSYSGLKFTCILVACYANVKIWKFFPVVQIELALYQSTRLEETNLMQFESFLYDLSLRS